MSIGNITCYCPMSPDSIVNISRSKPVLTLSLLAIVSNALTVFVLRRVPKRSSTENLLIAMAVSDFVLPFVHLIRVLRFVFFGAARKDEFFKTGIFYIWSVFYTVSILLTLTLAVRRCMAIEHIRAYQSLCSRWATKRIIFVVHILSGVLLSPILFYRCDFESELRKLHPRCMDEIPNEVARVSILMATTHWKEDYALRINYWMYTSLFTFQVMSSFVLVVLSFRFATILRKQMSSKSASRINVVRANKKTKLILTLSLLVLIRDLPLGLLSLFFIVSAIWPACLATVRLLTKDLTILTSAMNLVVFYYTNQRFKEAAHRSIGFASNPDMTASAGRASTSRSENRHSNGVAQTS